MKRVVLGFLALVMVALVAVQFVPFEYPRDNPPGEGTIEVPPEVVEILRRSCFDCHSNETRWPWYSHIAPISWMVTQDVAGGRSRLNLSEWQGLRDGFKRRLSRKIVERVEAGEMPMPRYRWLHPRSRVTARELELFRAWRDFLAADD